MARVKAGTKEVVTENKEEKAQGECIAWSKMLHCAALYVEHIDVHQNILFARGCKPIGRKRTLTEISSLALSSQTSCSLPLKAKKGSIFEIAFM